MSQEIMITGNDVKSLGLQHPKKLVNSVVLMERSKKGFLEK